MTPEVVSFFIFKSSTDSRSNSTIFVLLRFCPLSSESFSPLRLFLLFLKRFICR